MPVPVRVSAPHRRARRRCAVTALVTTLLAAAAVAPVPAAAAETAAGAARAAAPAASGSASAPGSDAAAVNPRPASRADVRRPVAPPPAAALPGAPDETSAEPRAATGPGGDGDDGDTGGDTGSGNGGGDGEGLRTAAATRPLARGVSLTTFDRLEPEKWLRADALNVDLGGSARVDYLSSGHVAKRATVSDMVARHDPGRGRRTVAATNADFFDIDNTGAPLGPGVSRGAPDHSPTPAGNTTALAFGDAADAKDAAGRILDLYFDGTATLPDGRHPLASYNAAAVPDDGIGLYTPQWGGGRAGTVKGAARVTEADVAHGTVTAVHPAAGTDPLPDGTTALLGRGAGAATLAKLKPGDHVATTYRPRTARGPLPRTAVGGRGLLVVDGKAQNWDGKPNNAAAPRTAVGFSRDGLTMHVLVVDGRQADSGGVTLTELGRMMRRLGCANALNLDGGGSSVLVAREAGRHRTTVENSPSDGSERADANGIAITAPAGDGVLRGYAVRTATDPAAAPTADPVRGGHPDRVFPGLTRRLAAAGHDRGYAPAPGAPHWNTADRSVGTVTAGGVFRARAPGTTRATARHGRATGSLPMHVLDRLARLRPTSTTVALADGRARGAFGLVGYDRHGDSAPVAPSDVRLAYDHDRFTVAPDVRTGGFTVTAAPGTAHTTGRVTATVAGRSTVLAVTVGLKNHRLASFDDAADWTFSAARATGFTDADPAGHTGTGLKLTYDFSHSTGTRAAYAAPPHEIPVPGRPQAFTLWVRGDGHGAWPSLELRDAAGQAQVLRGPYVTWTGWRRITFTVPATAAYPLRVHRFYLAETDVAKRYSGAVVLDDLAARVPPDAHPPAAPPVHDPLITTGAAVGRRDWRFAVLSGARLSAADPGGGAARRVRRALREVRAAKPELLLVDGDLVDAGTPADLAFAHRLLKRELGGAVPWVYVPGEREAAGGSIAAFEKEFGPAHRTFDHRGTRFVTLDTSRSTLRAGGLAQLRELRARLAAAERDRAVDSVAVVAHVPPRDPRPGAGRDAAARQLTDRKEAALLERWLAGFRRRTGKGAVFLGAHAGVFHASRVDGVPYLVTGNTGENPAAPPSSGGFTGWSMVGVDRVPAIEQQVARRERFRGGPDWISAAPRPAVAALALHAPRSLAAGAHGPVAAEVRQPDGRTVPVGWPVGADWTGSPGLVVVTGGGAGAGAGGDRAAGRGAGGGRSHRGGRRPVAAFDPATGRLTAHRPGTVTLTVAVNGVARTRRITVTG